MKFILASRDICEDSEFALLQAKKWLAWKNSDVEFIIKYANEEQPDINKDFLYCPVGSLEFCLKNLPGKILPRNIPACLAVGFISNTAETDFVVESFDQVDSHEVIRRSIANESQKVYVKSKTVFKHPANGVYDIAANDEICKAFNVETLDDLQITKFVDQIDSEWRMFVFKGKIEDIKLYSGSLFSNPPHQLACEDLVNAFEKSGEAPIAYTLDAAVCTSRVFDTVKTLYPVEVHDFFGCGLYGFDRPDIYPYMCHRWWFEWKKKAMLDG